MTVCVALLSDDKRSVVGISDQMVTAADIQFEPPQAKIFPITTSIVIMTAGDSSFNAEILAEVTETVRTRVEREPDDWWRVADVAKLYQQTAGHLSASKASAALLAPFDLDSQSFITRQSEMSEGFIEKMATELLNFSVPYAQVIITGIDKTGGHIFVVDNSEIMCLDKLGFASIGAGQWHANSQLMFNCYVPSYPAAGALFECYAAKKRAEVAPGVGSATDMFWILSLGGFSPINESVLYKLDEIYEEMRKSEQEAQDEAHKKWVEYVTDLLKQTAEKQPEQIQESGDGESSVNEGEKESDGDGNTPSDKKIVRKRSKKG